MELSTSVLAELLAMVRSRKGKQNVKTKVQVQQCIQCTSPANHRCRGLCRAHHRQFIYARDLAAEGVTLTKKDRANKVTLEMKEQQAKDEFDKAQTEAGMILASQQGKHAKNKKPNPFLRTA